jgi:peroxiredoxin
MTKLSCISALLLATLMMGCAKKPGAPVRIAGAPTPLVRRDPAIRLTSVNEAEAAPAVGARAPMLSSNSLSGGRVALDALRGKVVIVDFFATYCTPCKTALAEYRQIADDSRGQVAVIAIAEDERDDVSDADLRAFADELGLSFPIVRDGDHGLAKRFAIDTMPTTFVIDRDGTVRHVHHGYADGAGAAIAREVDALVGADDVRVAVSAR